ncbi:MAG TPA: hypothetical protein DD490_15700 [Acidobacteria bacterium]|nr:hypothetical protein [Acidobacteriota bacterium]
MSLLLLPLLGVLPSCALAPARARPGGAGGAAAPNAAFSRALETALARGAWQDLRIEAECRDEEVLRLRSLLLLGGGVGIWNQERQLAVPRERLLAALALLHDAGFAALRESYGGKGTGRGPAWGVEMICRVRAVLDGEVWQSVQLSQGEQSAGLKQLAQSLLALGKELAPAGVSAASLDDGLAKIARGELAPETLTLQLLRQDEDPAVLEGGWILRIEGGWGQVSHQSAATAWTTPRRILLPREEIATLAGRLAAAQVEELPANLYSSWYQDVEIRVLNRRRSLLARRFAGLTPESLGASQVRFNEITALLEAVQKRVDAAAADP